MSRHRESGVIAPGTTLATGVGSRRDVVEPPVALDESVLTVRDLRLSFGGIVALGGVSITVRRNAVGALIGPNGAGKTSLFNCISGLYAPDSGEIEFGGDRIDRSRACDIPQLGLARTFQEVALIPSLSVLENVMLGAYASGGLGFAVSVLRPRTAARRERAQRSKAMELLDSVGIDDLSNRRPNELPVGSLKRVELARALMADPSLVMLDEPACGLNHEEVAELADLVGRVRAERSLSILLVEHNMHLVRDLAEYVYVLDLGRIIAHGTLDEVSKHQGVIDAYLGGAL